MVRQTDNVGPSDKPDVWTLVELSAWTTPPGHRLPTGSSALVGQRGHVALVGMLIGMPTGQRAGQVPPAELTT